MADKKISQFTVANPLDGTEVVPILQTADNKKTTVNDFKSFVSPPGSVVFCGDYDASSNLFPTAGGTGTAGAIKKGNEFDISIGGTLAGIYVPSGSTIRARTDAPGQTGASWRIYF